MLTDDMFPMLCCPACRAAGLNLAKGGDPNGTKDEGTLSCPACQARFPVHGGIPELIPVWDRPMRQIETWEHHLDGFRARRTQRAVIPERQLARWIKKALKFAAFLNLGKGNLLDVGCGAGKFRLALRDSPVTYIGADPLPVEEAGEFRFVQALAEKLPFRDGTFSYVVVRSALDHFFDLQAFFQEARRVLKPDGRMFVEQVVLDTDGPLNLLKYAAHAAKDMADNLRTRQHRQSAPKHMHSFTTRHLKDIVQPAFRVERIERFDPKWYLPTQVMIELSKV